MLHFFVNCIDGLLAGAGLMGILLGHSLTAEPFKISPLSSILTITQGIIDESCSVNSEVLESLLERYGVSKGDSIVLIDEDDIAFLIEAIRGVECTVQSGGSGANTVSVFRKLGGGGSVAAVLGEDVFGEVYREELKEAGIVSNLAFYKNSATGSVRALIGQDGDRTMFVIPGVMNEFHELEVDWLNLVQSTQASIFFLDAYTWAFGKFHGQKNCTISDVIGDFKSFRNTKFAFSLGASLLVADKRDELLDLMPRVDFLFGNEDEMKALFQTEDIEIIKKSLKKIVPVAVLTLGKKGAWIVTPSEEIFVPAGKASAIDTTGAGDAFAGGFLWALEHGKTLKEAGQMGACVANEIIQHNGGRPKTDLSSVCLEGIGTAHQRDEF